MHITHGDPVWVELKTPEVDASAEFYRAVFGWELKPSETSPEGYYTATLADGTIVGGIASALDQDTGETIFETEWNVFLAVDNISETTARVPLAHGRILVSPMKMDSAGSLSIVEGPCGAMLGLWQCGEAERFDMGPAHGQPCWFELMSTNFESSLTFYKQVLDWDYHYISREGTMIAEPKEDARYRYAVNGDTGDATVGVRDAASILDEDTGSHWRLYLAVDDMEETIASVEKHGGRVLEGPRDAPFGVRAVIEDPQGARFHILHRKRG